MLCFILNVCEKWLNPVHDCRRIEVGVMSDAFVRMYCHALLHVVVNADGHQPANVPLMTQAHKLFGYAGSRQRNAMTCTATPHMPESARSTVTIWTTNESEGNVSPYRKAAFHGQLQAYALKCYIPLGNKRSLPNRVGGLKWSKRKASGQAHFQRSDGPARQIGVASAAAAAGCLLPLQL
jgi:hypothetical protein